MAPAGNGERPRHVRRGLGPPSVEQAVEGQGVRVEDRVLAVHVPHPVAERRGDPMAVHAHPEEMAGIEVGADRRAEGGHPGERLDVEHARARVQFQADPQAGILCGGELRQAGPVRFDLLLPLALIDAFQVGQPAARAEMRRPVPRQASRAARHGDHAADPQLGGQPDRVAEVLVMPPGKLAIRVQRVAPGVKGADGQPVPRYQVQPC